MAKEPEKQDMNKVAKNATWIIACKIVQSVLALVINMFTARYLGPSNYGLITYAASLVAFVVPLMQLGLSSIMVQELVNSPEEEGKILGTSITLSVVSSFACIAGVTAFAAIANRGEPVTIIVCLLYSLNLIFQALEMIRYWFQARLISKYTSIISLVAYVIVSGYKLFLLITAKNVFWFAVSNAFDFAIIAFGSLIVYGRKGGARFSFSWELAKRMLSKSRHYIVSGMMVTIFAQTDKIMLKLMLDETQTGYYGAAVECAGVTAFVFAAIIDSFRPSIFEAIKKNEETFEHRLKMLYSIVIYLSLAQSVAMTVFAKLVVRILYGAEYAPASGALMVVVWYTTFSYLGSVRNIWILAKDKQRYLWIINLLGAVANVILNASLIPFIGIYGAAIASLATQFFTNVIVGYILRPIRPNNRIMIDALNPKYLVEAAKRISSRGAKKADEELTAVPENQEGEDIAVNVDEGTGDGTAPDTTGTNEASTDETGEENNG